MYWHVNGLILNVKHVDMISVFVIDKRSNLVVEQPDQLLAVDHRTSRDFLRITGQNLAQKWYEASY